MDGDKRSNPLLEFSLLMLLIAFAVICAWNLDLSSSESPQPIDDDVVTVEHDDAIDRHPERTKWNEGKSLFKSNCASCHNPKADGTGPALLGVTERWMAAGDYKGKTGEEWLKIWVRNYDDAVKAGYPYAVNMANSRPDKMNMFAGMKDENIDKILLYVENPDANNKPVPQVNMSKTP